MFTFRHLNLFIFISLLMVEIIIAIFIKQPFIRNTFGDFLAVFTLYYFFKSFIHTSNLNLALITLLISFLIEFLQLIHVLELLNLQNNQFLSIVFGTTFSVTDLIAYTLGICTVFIFEKLISPQFSNQIF